MKTLTQMLIAVAIVGCGSAGRGGDVALGTSTDALRNCQQVAGEFPVAREVACPASTGSTYCESSDMTGSIAGQDLYYETASFEDDLFATGVDTVTTASGKIIFATTNVWEYRTNSIAGVMVVTGGTGMYAGATGRLYLTGTSPAPGKPGRYDYKGDLCLR